MQLRKISERSKLIIVGIIMSLILVLPQINSDNHTPIVSLETSIERHLSLGFEAPDNVPHAHENGTHEEALLEHQHDGHNSADHTHSPLYISSQNSWSEPNRVTESIEYIFSHTSPTPFLWQRPPKLTLDS